MFKQLPRVLLTVALVTLSGGTLPAQPGVSDGALARLTGPDSPLRPGETIGIFGDSITDQGGYVRLLEMAIAGSSFTRDRKIRVLNRGLNGGKVWDLINGGKMYGDELPPMDEAFESEDTPSLVVVFIGVNDVMHQPETSPGKFEAGLRHIMELFGAKGARLVLVTPAVAGELPRGKNPHDEKLDALAAITRRVAAETGAALVDLRSAFMDELARERAKNPDRPPRRRGILTHDGVHPSPRGNTLVADRIADGMVSALRPTLVPKPRSWERLPGHLVMDSVCIYSPMMPDEQAIALRDGIRTTFGVPARIADSDEWRRGEVNIHLGMEPMEHIVPPQQYEVSVHPDMVRITGVDAEAAAMGVATLLQLIDRVGENLVVPLGRVRDAPTHEYRGLLVDVARQRHEAGTIRELITLCHLYKIRYLQLHLTDDQSFTFPSKAFPKLATRGRAFTRKELEGLVEFAFERGVILVPELDVPGHTTAMRSAMPELFDSVDEKTGKMRNLSVLNMGNPAIYPALDTLVGELCEVFRTSPYVHIGADEAWLGRLHLSPDTGPALARLGSRDVHDLYLECIVRMHEIVKKHGRKTLVWEGFKGTGSDIVPVPRDMIVMAWESAYQLPQSLLKNGYQIINASWQPGYITPGARWSPEEIWTWNPYRWQNWVPGMPSYTPIQLAPSDRVLGGQMCSWEMAGLDQVEALRRRLPAFADRFWRPASNLDYADHARRVARVDRLFERLSRAVSRAESSPDSRAHSLARDGDGTFRDQVSVRFEGHGVHVHYTTDGSVPTVESTRYTGPITLTDSTRLRWVALRNRDDEPAGSVGVQQFTRRPFDVRVEGLHMNGAHRKFWQPRQEFTEELKLTFVDVSPGGAVRYTLDGNPPTPISKEVTGPLTFTETTDVRARWFDADGAARGEEFRRTFKRLHILPNLALGKAVRASDFVNAAHAPDLAVDGIVDRDRHWDSSKGAPQWLEIDLGKPEDVARLVVFPYWDGRRSYRYRVESSVDQKTWSPLVDMTRNEKPASEHGHEHRFAPRSIRYIRVTMLSNSANPGLHLVEVQAFPPKTR